MTLQVMSAILVLAAFVLACAGIYLVGRAAWPLYRGEPEEEPEAGAEATIAATSHQLTRGLLMTFLSIAALALATVSSWWPKDEGAGGGASGGAQVQVQTNDGQTACGELAVSPRVGTLRLVTGSQPLDVALGTVASVAPVGSC
jgi:hypothetical protein